MKSRLFIWTIGLCYSLNCFAQAYQPLLQENTQWNIMHHFHTTINTGYEKTEILSLGGDTVVMDKTYSKLYSTYNEQRSDSSLIGLLREDTISARVYYMAAGEAEKLLYDFHAQVGDTLYTYCKPHIPDSVINVVTAIDSIEINTIWHKKITLDIILPYDDKKTQEWIEGIGSDQGVIYRTYDVLVGGESCELLCMHRNNNLIYSTLRSEDFGCFVWNIDNALPNVTMDNFCISCDDSQSLLFISEKNGEKICADLFDMRGNCIYQTSKPQTEIKIATQTLISGLYLLRIRTKEHMYVQKVNL